MHTWPVGKKLHTKQHPEGNGTRQLSEGLPNAFLVNDVKTHILQSALSQL